MVDVAVGCCCFCCCRLLLVAVGCCCCCCWLLLCWLLLRLPPLLSLQAANNIPPVAVTNAIPVLETCKIGKEDSKQQNINPPYAPALSPLVPSPPPPSIDHPVIVQGWWEWMTIPPSSSSSGGGTIPPVIIVVMGWFGDPPPRQLHPGWVIRRCLPHRRHGRAQRSPRRRPGITIGRGGDGIMKC